MMEGRGTKKKEGKLHITRKACTPPNHTPINAVKGMEGKKEKLKKTLIREGRRAG